MDGSGGEDPPSSPIPFELRASSLLNGPSCTKSVPSLLSARVHVVLAHDGASRRGVRATFDIPRRHPRPTLMRARARIQPLSAGGRRVLHHFIARAYACNRYTHAGLVARASARFTLPRRERGAPRRKV